MLLSDSIKLSRESLWDPDELSWGVSFHFAALVVPAEPKGNTGPGLGFFLQVEALLVCFRIADYCGSS